MGTTASNIQKVREVLGSDEYYRIREIRESVYADKDEEKAVVYLEGLQPPVGIQVPLNHEFQTGQIVQPINGNNDIRRLKPAEQKKLEKEGVPYTPR